MALRLKKYFIFNIFLIIGIFYLVFLKQNNENSDQKQLELHEEIIDFESFDNINGLNRTIIPNIVHLLYLQHPYFKFYQLVNILTIYYNHKPEFIYFHCGDCNFSGNYFNILKQYKQIWNLIKIFKIPFKKTIFGVEYGWLNHHRYKNNI